MSISLVIFDISGTTVDDPGAVNRCFRESLAVHGFAVEPEAVDAIMGLPKPEALRILLGRSLEGDVLLNRIDAIHADFVARMIAYYAFDPSVREIAGISALFQRLKSAGVKVALNTGFNREIADVVINRLCWFELGLIDASVASDEVSGGRPLPDMIEHLMVVLNIDDPKRVIKIGDAPADLEEGLAAGCRWVIGVTWGTHTRSQLMQDAHTHLVDTVEELTLLLDSALNPPDVA